MPDFRSSSDESGTQIGDRLSFSRVYAWFQALVPIVMFPFLFVLLIVELCTETQYLNLEIIVLILVILFLPFVPYLTEFEIFGAKGSFEDPEFKTAKENVGEAAPPSDEGGVVPGEDEIL